jgi:hypothetical protein
MSEVKMNENKAQQTLWLENMRQRISQQIITEIPNEINTQQNLQLEDKRQRE